MPLGVGDTLPEFEMKAVAPIPMEKATIENVFVDISSKSYPGKWLCLFFYPKDFTFVCPTEIQAFGDLNEEFADRDCQVLTASTDSEFVHWAWRRDQEELKNLPFPMLADVKRELTSALGILDRNEGVAQRAVFLIDPEGVIRFSMITDLSVGRNPKEVLRVLDALQTDELCPCNWKKGDSTIDVSAASAPKKAA
ncbi:MAG: alkyl hydroperoxide reductase [Rickettsiales bacterium]|nr:alkyl hydroperoxide reductase [Rickettsiales bacterium]|tara:strand:+ start:815 stop:1399 length:585 start_codon:yes stop_codon:yes gene_type:complete